MPWVSPKPSRATQRAAVMTAWMEQHPESFVS
jgi:hypothetical protein